MTSAPDPASPRKVYVASSFRNERQPAVVEMLRSDGHEVYDPVHPDVEGPGAPPRAGAGWKQAGPDWRTWTPDQYLDALRHPLAVEGFAANWDAMQWADRFVLVMPCGRSAHLEAGYAVGSGKPLAILLEPHSSPEPELMHKMASLITCTRGNLLKWVATTKADAPTVGISGGMAWCQCCGPNVDANGDCLCTLGQCGTDHVSHSA